MNTDQTLVAHWYQVTDVQLLTPAAVGASWLLELRNSEGGVREAFWVVNDLPGVTVPAIGDWGMFELACYDVGGHATFDFVHALHATLAS